MDRRGIRGVAAGRRETRLDVRRRQAVRDECLEHLPRDQRVELLTVETGEVAILDESAIAEAAGSNQWAVPLDPDGIGEPVAHMGAQLRVVGVKQLGDVGQRVNPSPHTLAQPSLLPSRSQPSIELQDAALLEARRVYAISVGTSSKRKPTGGVP